MADVDLSAADAVAIVHEWLRDHPDTLTILGGPEHVSGLPEAPWPHLVVSAAPGGNPRDFVWSSEQAVNLEVCGSPDGSPGQASLWRKAVQLAQRTKQLVDLEVDTTDPVVGRVGFSGVVNNAPTSAGQPRQTLGLLVVVHPPVSQPIP